MHSKLLIFFTTLVVMENVFSNEIDSAASKLICNNGQEKEIQKLKLEMQKQQYECSQKVSFLENELNKTRNLAIRNSLNQEKKEEQFVKQLMSAKQDSKREYLTKLKDLFREQRDREKAARNQRLPASSCPKLP